VLLTCLVLLAACHKQAQVKIPVPQARTCPANSVEFVAVNYCSDPPKCEHSTPVAAGELCMAIDPVTKRPLGLFFKGDSCNPFTEQDCDAPDVGKQGKKRDQD